jgi:Matrixin
MTARARAALAIAALLVWPAAQRAQAYLKAGIQVDGQSVPLAWRETPVHYLVNDRTVEGVEPEQLRDAAGAAFATWQNVSSATVAFQFDGYTGAEPLHEDGANTLGFLARPDLERTLAATSYLVDTRTGELLEADIFFNSMFAWSVAPGGEPGRYDLQAIATHEIGHFLGLGHSALGETEPIPGGRRLIASGSAMFPIAFAAGSTAGRMLWPDDVAGVSDLYPVSGFAASTGTLQGTVTKGGLGVFGAHAIAYNLATGALVGGFALDPGGGFAIAGLAPGTYLVRVEPLDDADVGSFLDDAARVDTDFRVTYYPALVTVPRGGGSAAVNVMVAAK